MKHILILLIVLFACAFLGCAQTTSNLEQAVKVFKTGHEKMQELADATQTFCQLSRAQLEAQKVDTTELKKYCEEAWDMFQSYKKATDVLLDPEE